MTNGELILTLLDSAEAQIAAARALIERGATAPALSATLCVHPMDRRKPMMASGDLGQFQCTACNQIISGKPAEAAQ